MPQMGLLDFHSKTLRIFSMSVRFFVLKFLNQKLNSIFFKRIKKFRILELIYKKVK